VVKFTETVDGNIWLDHASGRVKLYIQSKGHGLYGDHARWGGGDAIWYYRPAGEQGNPAALNTTEPSRVFDYELEDMLAPGGLWDHRYDTRVFRQKESGQWGMVCRKKLTEGSRIAGAAHAPWSWNDRDDRSPMGEIVTDPAHFILRYAQGWGPVSTQYVANRYLEV
jgi:hypothetical protein